MKIHPVPIMSILNHGMHHPGSVSSTLYVVTGYATAFGGFKLAPLIGHAMMSSYTQAWLKTEFGEILLAFFGMFVHSWGRNTLARHHQCRVVQGGVL